ncbi:DUF1016 N-terminal domain-containing protein [Aliarcobacter butzleri]|uniref:DUF1016 N-terminal domain-containing protein n=1 Tax=Aliarcobacter butzleri TaxID=28197 RepID=UPI0021B6430D|nr:DUF1016 N-terminal domain-containing protein [Aliarcobacter butzleri]MCT7569966.1 DUF1016 N-terminal domain-containing protein [Aliarcobacter butzleri]
MKEINNSEFNQFVKDIKSKIYTAKSKAILSANKLMIELYFDIGKNKNIVEKQEALGWGIKLILNVKFLMMNFRKTRTHCVRNLQQLVGEIKNDIFTILNRSLILNWKNCER